VERNIKINKKSLTVFEKKTEKI